MPAHQWHMSGDWHCMQASMEECWWLILIRWSRVDSLEGVRLHAHKLLIVIHLYLSQCTSYCWYRKLRWNVRQNTLRSASTTYKRDTHYKYIVEEYYEHKGRQQILVAKEMLLNNYLNASLKRWSNHNNFKQWTVEVKEPRSPKTASTNSTTELYCNWSLYA